MGRQQFVRLCMCGCGEPTLLAVETHAKYGWRKGQPMRFLANHGPAPRRPASERFWEKVNADGACWEWDGYRDEGGYGRFRWHRRQNGYAHRLAWESLVGPIPEGMALDHLCRHRCCVNPDHLEVVTPQENARRSNALSMRKCCAKGHEFTPANTMFTPRGRRYCRTCKQDSNARYRAQQSERAALAEAPGVAA